MASPHLLLQPFLELYGIDAANVSKVELDHNNLFVLEHHPSGVVREITVRQWRQVAPTPADSIFCNHGNHLEERCYGCEAEAADTPVPLCPHGLIENSCDACAPNALD